MAGATSYEHVIVGSGINALVCAAMLAKSGKKICLLERNDRIGGCIRTEACTLPGFTHDIFSQWYPLFLLSGGYAELGPDLHRHGLTFEHTEKPTAALLPNDNGFVLYKDRAKTLDAMRAIDAQGADNYGAAMAFMEANAEITFATLGEPLWRMRYFYTVLKTLLRQGPLEFSRRAAEFSKSARQWLTRDFDSELIRACFAPWVLHAGLFPDAVFSGHMAKLICFSLEAVGTPVVKGGAQNLLDAFSGLIEEHAGVIRVNSDVNQVVVDNGRASGVTLVSGEFIEATQAVICSTTPGQLYCKLLAQAKVPNAVRDEAAAFRHGLGGMQIHLALSAPPRWRNSAMDTVAMVHLTPGLDGVSAAIGEATRGLLPRTATVVVGQPCVLDPSRAPQGQATLWIQLQELPRVVDGDAAAELEIPSDGSWTEKLREQYADRIIDRIAQHIPQLKSIILARRVYSPADLEAANINLVGGDPYGGDCHWDQFLFWRPLTSTKNHATPFKGLFHIGASTHPGPGLGGGSGFIVAKSLR